MTCKKDEEWVRKKAMGWLEGEGCIKPRGVRFPLAEYKVRQPDLVGVTKEGEVYVVECKGGEINRPVQGLEILYYRALIEKEFKRCMDYLENRRKEWKEGVKKARRPKLRFYLALSSNHRGLKLLKYLERRYKIFKVKIF